MGLKIPKLFSGCFNLKLHDIVNVSNIYFLGKEDFSSESSKLTRLVPGALRVPLSGQGLKNYIFVAASLKTFDIFIKKDDMIQCYSSYRYKQDTQYRGKS